MPLALGLALFCSAQTLGHPSEGPPSRQALFWLVRLPLHQTLVGVFILALCNHPTGAAARLLSLPVMVWIGRLSYSLYLWHSFVFWHVNWYAGRFLPEGALGGLLMETLRLGATLLVASGSYYLVERPFLRLKKLWQPKAPGGAQAKGRGEAAAADLGPRRVAEPAGSPVASS
jgi:peptidoglycan/LPS O-acetylase OafA/YrhL